MKCEDVEGELIGYHFGIATEGAREAIESHLLGCQACLRAFLEVKRAIETAAIETGHDAPAPSTGSRARLRRAVATELGLGARPWTWWERPVAFAFAAMAVVIAMGATRALTGGPGSPPHAMTDVQGR